MKTLTLLDAHFSFARLAYRHKIHIMRHDFTMCGMFARHGDLMKEQTLGLCQVCKRCVKIMSNQHEGWKVEES